ncbi:hypothetical protein FBU31_003220 [Coemansia sp. 'formosensis']|nr:hypothetical protein FBU31_003220 [Coemansia sp. 'formosensis']
MSDKTARDLLHLAGEQGDQYSLSVETAATTARAQIPGHDPKSALLPPPSFSVRPVGQGALGDDDDIIMDKTAVHISNSEVVPGCLPSARSGTQSTQAVPHISEQPESPASTCSTRSRHTPFNKSAISGNNTNADDSNDKQLDEWRVITRSRSKALVSNTRGLAKKDIGLVGKTKSKPGSPPKGTKKRESDDKVKNIAWRPAKRRKL